MVKWLDRRFFLIQAMFNSAGRELRETIETKESEDLATHQLAKLGSSSLQSTAKVASPDKKESSTDMIMKVR